VARERREDTPSELESLDEEEEEEGGGVTAPPTSPLCETLPSFGVILSQQVGVVVSLHEPKWTRTEIGRAIGRLAAAAPTCAGIS
jgi:hypothetical protein